MKKSMLLSGLILGLNLHALERPSELIGKYKLGQSLISDCSQELVIELEENNFLSLSAKNRALPQIVSIANDRSSIYKTILKAKGNTLSIKIKDTKRILGLRIPTKTLNTIDFEKNLDLLNIEYKNLTDDTHTKCEYLKVDQLPSEVEAQDEPVDVDPVVVDPVDTDDDQPVIVDSDTQRYLELANVEYFNAPASLDTVHEVFEGDREQVKAKLKNRATLSYSYDTYLATLLLKHEARNVDDIIYILELQYFTGNDIAKMNEILVQNQTDKHLTQEELKNLENNFKVASTVQFQLSKMVKEILAKVDSITTQQAIAILKLITVENTTNLTSIDSSILSLLNKKAQGTLDLEAARKIVNSRNLKESMAESIILELAPNANYNARSVETLNRAEIDEDVFNIVVGKLIIADTNLTIDDSINLVIKNSNNGQRHQILSNKLSLATTATYDQLYKASKRVENGSYSYDQLKDDLISKYYKKLSNISLDEHMTLIDEVESYSTRQILNLKYVETHAQGDISVITKLSKNLKNGSYNYNQHKDDFIVKALKLNKLSVNENSTLELIKEVEAHAPRANIALALIPASPVTIERINTYAKLLNNGSYNYNQYRDDFIIKASAKLEQIQADSQLNSLLERIDSHANRADLLKKNISKLQTMDAQQAKALLKNIDNGSYNYNQYRDNSAELLVVNYKVIVNSATEVTQVIDELGNAKKATLANMLVQSIESLSYSDLALVAKSIANGSHNYDQYKEDFIIKSVSLVNSSNTTQMAQLVEASASDETKNKISKHFLKNKNSVSVMDVYRLASLTKNGSYNYNQYRDDLVKDVLAKIDNASIVETKKLMEILDNHGYRKTLALTLLQKNIVEVSKQNINELANSISNGSYSYNQHKTDFLKAANALL